MKNCVTILLKISCLYPIHVNFCQCIYAMERGNTIFNPSPPPYQTPISPPTPPLAVSMSTTNPRQFSLWNRETIETEGLKERWYWPTNLNPSHPSSLFLLLRKGVCDLKFYMFYCFLLWIQLNWKQY